MLKRQKKGMGERMEMIRGKALFMAIALALGLISCAGPDVEIKKKETSEGYYRLGVAYLTGGDYRRAVVELDKAIELNPNDPSYYNAMGLAYFYDRKVDQAIPHFQKAVQLDTKLSEAYNNLGAAYVQKRMWQDAITAFTRALANPLYATPERAYYNLANVYYQMGRVNEAIEEYKKALDIAPDFDAAHNDLGFVYYQQGKIDLAIEEFKRAIKTNPDYALAHHNLALAYYTKMGNLDRGSKEYKELKIMALESFRKVIKLAPAGPLAEDAQRYLKQLE